MWDLLGFVSIYSNSQALLALIYIIPIGWLYPCESRFTCNFEPTLLGMIQAVTNHQIGIKLVPFWWSYFLSDARSISVITELIVGFMLPGLSLFVYCDSHFDPW
jgi:hypothetical protein